MSGSIVRGSEVLIRRVVQLNLAYVLGVGLYGLAIDEPYWREVGRAPGIYDGLFWLGLAVNGPSGFLADWLSSFARPFGSEVRFVLQCLLWSVLLWGQWRFYFLVANWSANRVKLVHALTFFAVVLALLGAVVAREAWLFGHRPSEFFVDQYFLVCQDGWTCMQRPDACRLPLARFSKDGGAMIRLLKIAAIVLVAACVQPPVIPTIRGENRQDVALQAPKVDAVTLSHAGAEAAVRLVQDTYRNVNTAIDAGRASSTRYCQFDDEPEWLLVSRNRASDEECSAVALVSRLDGLPRKVVLTDASQGGDWIVTVEYYFFVTGVTAFRFEQTVSYQGRPIVDGGPTGPFVREVRTYFDESAQIVRELEKAIYEPTGESVSPDSIRRIALPYYRRAADFPVIATRAIRPQPPVTDEDVTERIRAIFRSAKVHVDHDAGEEMFAAPDSDAYDRGAWHELRAVPTEDAFIATVYCVDGNPVMFKVEVNSEDWNDQAEYYLYPTGKVAFRFETLRTFHGTPPEGAEEGTGLFIVEDRQYFDEAGKRVQHLRSAYVDNKAKTPVELEGIQRNGGPSFQAVEQTPFYKLSRCRRGGIQDAGR